MKKIYFVVSFLMLVFFFTAGSSYSQISLSVGPSIGMTLPTVDYSGETSDFYVGTKYGLRSGFNYGAVAKVGLGPLNGKLGISYVSMENTGKGDPSKANSSLDIKNSIFMISLGTEFGFAVPLSPIKPYAGIDILFSTISGSFRFQGSSNVDSDEHSIASASRTGLGLNLGAEVKTSRSMTFDLSLHYNLINLFSKDYKSGTNRVDAYSSLNDAQDPLYSATDPKHPIGNTRTIATIQVQLAVLFGF